MPNTNWDHLTPLQLGRYAEYFARMEFASYGLEVYTSEVDDHGIDFVVKDKRGSFAEIQVKSLRGMGYVFMPKTKFDIRNRNLYLALLIFTSGQLPDIFLIPVTTWQKPEGIFVDRDYDKEGQTSKPEYGVNISQKHYPELERFKFQDVIRFNLIIDRGNQMIIDFPGPDGQTTLNHPARFSGVEISFE